VSPTIPLDLELESLSRDDDFQSGASLVRRALRVPPDAVERVVAAVGVVVIKSLPTRAFTATSMAESTVE